jgi:hypothetical protein
LRADRGVGALDRDRSLVRESLQLLAEGGDAIGMIALLGPAEAGAVEVQGQIDAKNGNLLVSAAADRGAALRPDGGRGGAHLFQRRDLRRGRQGEAVSRRRSCDGRRADPTAGVLYLADEPLDLQRGIKAARPARARRAATSCSRVVDGITIFDACP